MIKNNITAVRENLQLRRWLITINNPIFADSSLVEVDPEKTDLILVNDRYDTSIFDEIEDGSLIEYRCIQTEDKAVKRPFFADQNAVETYFKNLQEAAGIKYTVYQYERGENGTPHIQGFVIYKNGKRFRNVKQDFPTAHIVPARGTNVECRDYCMKTDTRIAGPVELGEFQEMRARTDLENFHALIEAGASNRELKTLYRSLYSQFGVDKIERFRQDHLKTQFGEQFRDVQVTYIYGTTRTGKTSFVYDKHPMSEICRVCTYDKGAFDGYTAEKMLLLDEFTGQLSITMMNNLLDRYPFQMPARYTNRTACFENVYIVSNLPLSELYKNTQHQYPEIYNAFVKRIKNIIRFTGLGEWHFEMRDGKRVINTNRPLNLINRLELVEGEDLPFG